MYSRYGFAPIAPISPLRSKDSAHRRVPRACDALEFDDCSITRAIDFRRSPFGSGVVGPGHLSVDYTSLCESQLALMELS